MYFFENWIKELPCLFISLPFHEKTSLRLNFISHNSQKDLNSFTELESHNHLIRYQILCALIRWHKVHSVFHSAADSLYYGEGKCHKNPGQTDTAESNSGVSNLSLLKTNSNMIDHDKIFQCREELHLLHYKDYRSDHYYKYIQNTKTVATSAVLQQISPHLATR